MKWTGAIKSVFWHVDFIEVRQSTRRHSVQETLGMGPTVLQERLHPGQTQHLKCCYIYALLSQTNKLRCRKSSVGCLVLKCFTNSTGLKRNSLCENNFLLIEDDFLLQSRFHSFNKTTNNINILALAWNFVNSKLSLPNFWPPYFFSSSITKIKGHCFNPHLIKPAKFKSQLNFP